MDQALPVPMSHTSDPLLPAIDAPAVLRQLTRPQLHQVAHELREFLLHSVSRTGGHLSSNLGTVELTVALHHVFNTPHDRLVWDVGHQAYPHKILTGRREAMATLKKLGGISGFPRRCESAYDTFGVGHSSTSISAALGMAHAARLKGEQRRVVAVIGDGALTGGMAFEALNHGGYAGGAGVPDMLVILNDNDMSISPPVGALNGYLARLLSGKFYAAARAGAKSVLKHTPLYEFAKRVEEQTKGMVVPSTIFEAFGFNYVGPIDGHDLDALIPTLENLRDAKGPQFLHVVTKKGYGYHRAEVDPIGYHGPGTFDPAIGLKPAGAPGKQTFTQVFGQWLCDMAEVDPRLVGITPAMREGSGMVEFALRFPTRYHDVGIAEQHAVTFAAGLACEGLKPVVAIYSTFLQRAYDQLIHDVALQNLPVMFAIDRGGLVGADGPTHHGTLDLSFLSCVPNMVVMAPADEAECRQMLTTAFLHDGPAAVRYPRGGGTGAVPAGDLAPLPLGKGEVLRQGKEVALLAFGSLVAAARRAGDELDASVANMRFIKPLDVDLLAELGRNHSLLVSIEENTIIGGAGAEIERTLSALGIATPVLRLGLPDRFIEHGDQARLLADLGLDHDGIVRAVRETLANLR